MSKTHYIIPFFVSHQGCPYDCVFCNQNKITGTNSVLSAKDVHDQVEKFTLYMKSKSDIKIEIAFFGGSFTGINIEKQDELLNAASSWYEKGVIQDIRISTRPDYISEEILRNLKRYNVSIIELGVQSLDDTVLDKCNRGHTSIDVEIACKLIRKFKIKLGLQMMIGLPGDTPEKSIETARKIVSLSPDFARIYPTLVVKNTELENMFLRGEYLPLTLEDAIQITKIIYRYFSSNSINIIRIGLQPTENIMEGKDVIAGPFHPAFRQLVEADMYKECISDFLKDHVGELSNINFEVNSKSISKLVGNKRSNLEFLKKSLKIDGFKIYKNEELCEDEFKIIINGNESILKPI